jgi:hypothetical protein
MLKKSSRAIALIVEIDHDKPHLHFGPSYAPLLGSRTGRRAIDDFRPWLAADRPDMAGAHIYGYMLSMRGAPIGCR